MNNSNFLKNYILIIVLILSFLSSANSLSQPKSVEETFNEEPYNPIFYCNESQDDKNRSTDNTSPDEFSLNIDPGVIVTVMNFSYPVFVFIALYMFCAVGKDKNLENGILLFLYLSNNGYIIVSLSVGIFDEFEDMTLYFLAPELLILILVTIYYIYKLGKGICDDAMEKYFSCDEIGYLFKLPCIGAWSLIKLTEHVVRQKYMKMGILMNV